MMVKKLEEQYNLKPIHIRIISLDETREEEFDFGLDIETQLNFKRAPSKKK